MSRNALYKQISGDLQRMIQEGALPPGAKIPSAPDLREQYRISHMTALKIYRELLDRHLVEQKAGLGYFVRGRQPEADGWARGRVACLTRPFRAYTPQDNYFNDINLGVQQKLMQGGYAVVIPSCAIHLNDYRLREDRAPEIAKAVAELDPQVDGFILDERILDEHLETLMAITSKPMVLVNRMSTAALDAVVPDNCDGARQLAELGLRLGYERFVVCQQIYNSNYEERGRFFLEALRDNGVDSVRTVLVERANLEPTGTVADKVLAALGEKGKSLIFAMGDLLARSLCRELRARGVEFGKGNTGLAGFGGYSCADTENPKLCTVAIDAVALGGQAVTTLLARINHETKDAPSVDRIPAALRLGETV